MKAINFYSELWIWPALLLFLGIWKGFGYSSVMYYATIMGIDPTYYEAATVDGASKWQRIRNVTIPQLSSLITVLTILAVGNIFRADFGLFYQIPHNAGALYNVTNVIDVYVYNGLTKSGGYRDGSSSRSLPIGSRFDSCFNLKYHCPSH